VEYLISRNFKLPTTGPAFEKEVQLQFNLWQKKRWPYCEFETGDILYWYETRRRAICWKTRTIKADRLAYSSKGQLFDWLHSNFGGFDENNPYVVNAQNKRYCLAFKSEPLLQLNLPKPKNTLFPRLGWLRADDELAKTWLSQQRS
jgi:hypothetical protein